MAQGVIVSPTTSGRMTRQSVQNTDAPTTTRQHAAIALLSLAASFIHLLLRFGFDADRNVHRVPLIAALVLGGIPLVWKLAIKLSRRQFGSDLLAGISIVTSVLLGEYLAGTLVV